MDIPGGPLRYEGGPMNIGRRQQIGWWLILMMLLGLLDRLLSFVVPIGATRVVIVMLVFAGVLLWRLLNRR
jgi:hypothetical protein